MAADSSFDIVTKVDHQEVDNALNQTAKEIAQRYDFKGVGASIAWSGETVLMKANSEERVQGHPRRLRDQADQARDLAEVARRGRAQQSGKEYKLFAVDRGGHLPARTPRRSPRSSATEGPKGVKAQIQGDELRVSAKSRDDLQAVHRPAQGRGPRRRAAVRQLPLGSSLGLRPAPAVRGERTDAGSVPLPWLSRRGSRGRPRRRRAPRANRSPGRASRRRARGPRSAGATTRG